MLSQHIVNLIISAMNTPNPSTPIHNQADSSMNRLSQKGRRKRARWTGNGRKK